MSNRPRFGELLREYRAQHQLSQTDVARILGCNSSLISRIEGNQKNPPKRFSFYQNLYLLPGIRDIQVDTLLDSTDVPKGYAEVVKAWRRDLLTQDGATSQSLLERNPSRVLEARIEGVRAILHIEADNESITEEELSAIATSAKIEMEYFLSFYLLHLKNRRLRHKTDV